MQTILKLNLLLVFSSLCLSIQPVDLKTQAQKFRTFYLLNDPIVPKSVKRTTSNPWVIASDGAVWHSDSLGLWRIQPSAPPRDRTQFFAGLRYLPDNDIQQLAPDSWAGIWVRTKTGVSHIELRPMTMAAKADIFETRIRERHDRHGLVSPSNLLTRGDLRTSQTRDDDNDGLWTSMYAAAECFRYAVTHSAAALADAKKSIEAVLFLEEVTGISGFPARSYIRKGEPMPHDGQWHWTDDGQYYWKGDTSSDEIVGHMFLYSIAMDLLPDAALKKRISATAARIMDHIVGHGYYLIDIAGKPTKWGRWSPEYFKQNRSDSPLNAVQLLSFLKCAAHITGNSRYEAEYQKVAWQMGYAELSTHYLHLREEINYSDEELAMLAFYGLFRYEKDPTLLYRYYRPAIDTWWQNESREENPLWTIIYATANPDGAVDLEAAAHTLYRMPIDIIDWPIQNSQRPDVVMESAVDRFHQAQAKVLLPPDERPIMKWNGNPFVVDRDSRGESEDDGTAFLLPYWMGRYHNLFLGE